MSITSDTWRRISENIIELATSSGESRKQPFTELFTVDPKRQAPYKKAHGGIQFGTRYGI